MTTHQCSFHRVLALSIVLAAALPTFALPSRRSVRGKRTPARIVFDKSEVELGPNQTVNVRATVLDARGSEIPNANIEWVLQGPTNIVTLHPLNKAKTAILMTAADSIPPAVEMILRAKSGLVSGDFIIHLRSSDPAEIVFPDGNKVELPVLGHKTIRAYVLDAQGNRIRNAAVIWNLADPDLDSFVLVGSNINKDGVNSVEIAWLGGRADLKTPTEVKLVARSGSKARGIVTIEYKTPTAEVVKVSTDSKEVRVGPGEAKTLEVTVRGEDDRLLKDIELEATVADETAKKYILVTTDKKTITVIGLAGDEKSEPPAFIKTALVIKAKKPSTITTVPLIYQREAAAIYWDILPPNIVGDNYGHTIKRDYYCIEVTIENNSGADLALAGLRFYKDDIWRPNTSYSTVHGSLAKRKLTHPRTMTLAIIDGLGTLMTGFNPFFHNINHAKNFSQFIDIVSNPFAKGLDKAWKDPYPDELARFEQDVLRDDKIIPNNGVFKTKIFVPKRVLFTNDQKKDREDLDKVRKALGKLYVLGYKFQKGTVQSVGSSR